MDGQPPLIFGDGLQTMDFVYTSDVARANVLEPRATSAHGVYNIASGTETSLLEMAQALLRVMDSDLQVEHGPARLVNSVVRRLADTSAARQDLGFKAEVELERASRGLVQLVEAAARRDRRDKESWCPVTAETVLARINVMKPWLGDEEAQALAEVVASGWVAQGPKVKAFESDFQPPRRRCVTPSRRLSCTTALHLALIVAGIGPGDDVVVPSLSLHCHRERGRLTWGRGPCSADVDPLTGNVTAETIHAALTLDTRAVIVVDQGGMPVDLDPIRELCDRHEITVIEDAACGVGSQYKGRPVGTGADVSVWSFHPRKILTTGEGGMLTTRRADWAARARTPPGTLHECLRHRPARIAAGPARGLPRDRVQLPDD